MAKFYEEDGSITSTDRVLDEYSTVSVRIVITFFETIDENTNLEGLTVINN